MIHIFSENNSYVAEEAMTRKRVNIPQDMIAELDRIRDDDNTLSSEAAFRKWMAVEEQLEDMLISGAIGYAE